MSDDKEERILKMFDKSSPQDEDLFETSYVNHIAWSITIVALGLVVWLAVALVRAENQRYALEKGMCRDQVFKEQVDKPCLKLAESRDHWWEHLWFGLTHVR